MSIPVDSTHTSRVSEIPVLISGAGPTGLFAALLLGKMGVPYRLIERDQEFSPLSKALWIHSRTMEILQMSDPGLIQQALDQGKIEIGHRFFFGGKFVQEMELKPKNDSYYNNLVHLQQAKTIRIFSKEMEKQGGKVDWGWELVDTKVVETAVDASGVRENSWVETTIRRALDGTNKRAGEYKVLGTVDLAEEDEEKQYEYETIRSQFLIGADGARSAVRHKVDIPFLGRTRDVYMMAFDGTVDANVSLDHINWMYNASPVVMFPLGGDRVLIVGNTGPLTQEEFEAKKNETLTLEVFEKYLEENASPQKFTIKTVNWLSYYRVNERRAQDFRYKDRIFLAGDAAHIHSPSGGLGLNLGIQDSYNLAWRIALVVKGTASLSLLDSYGEERAAIADEVIKLSGKLLDEDFEFVGIIQRTIRRIIITFAPIFRPIIALMAAPVAMMTQDYHENSLNKRHKTQSAPSGPGAVGRRAGDAPLVPLPGNTPTSTPGNSDDNPNLSLIDNEAVSTEPTPTVTTRLHELIAYPGIFQILVFTGNQWKDDPQAATSLSASVEKYLGMWRSKWCTVGNQGGEKMAPLNRLIMVHTITTLSDTNTPNPLSDKDAGEGKAYVDLKGVLHGRYSVETVVKKGRKLGGAIVVIRPDSHISYRVQGVDESAWNDVSEYFASILI